MLAPPCPGGILRTAASLGRPCNGSRPFCPCSLGENKKSDTCECVEEWLGVRARTKPLPPPASATHDALHAAWGGIPARSCAFSAACARRAATHGARRAVERAPPTLVVYLFVLFLVLAPQPLPRSALHSRAPSHPRRRNEGQKVGECSAGNGPGIIWEASMFPTVVVLMGRAAHQTEARPTNGGVGGAGAGAVGVRPRGST